MSIKLGYFSQEDLDLIDILKNTFFPKFVECLESKPYVEGLCEAHHIFLDILGKYWSDGDAFIWLIFQILEWLRGMFDASQTEKEKRKRTNQTVAFCFFLTVFATERYFLKVFDKYVIPLITKPDYTESQIAESVWKKVYEVCFAKGGKKVLLVRESKLYKRFGYLESEYSLDFIRDNPDMQVEYAKIYKHCFP